MSDLFKWDSGKDDLPDHGSLPGLADDDHPQYLLADGSRAVNGDLRVASGVVVGNDGANNPGAGEIWLQQQVAFPSGANGIGKLVNKDGFLYFVGSNGIAYGVPSVDGWQPIPHTLTYATAQTVTIPGDVTGLYPKGTKIWLVQTTSKFFYVLNAVYSSPNTTLTLVGGTDYTLANAAITSPMYSFAAAPRYFPTWFSYTPTVTPSSGTFTTVSATGQFAMQGQVCFLKVWVTITTNGTAVGILASLPCAVIGFFSIAAGREYNATGFMCQGIMEGSNMTIYKYDNSNINGDNRAIVMTGTYSF